MNSIYLIGAKCIKLLQDIFPDATRYFTPFSEAADPAKAFLMIFPASCVLSLPLGANVVTGSVIAEWTNILLKWILMEHRPYWWVNLGSGRPELKQSKLSCEMGPGSPSGHLTGITVVCFIIAKWLCSCVNEGTLLGRSVKRRINNLIWLLFWILIINVMLSRMYLATHFPHQCILGIFAGFWIGKLTWKYSKQWMNAPTTKWLFASFLFASIGITVYIFQLMIGVNPNWTFHLASSWCSSPGYLNVQTMPLFALVRDVSVIFGIALSSPLSKRMGSRYSKKIAAVLSFLTYIWYQMMMKKIPAQDSNIFYAGYFLLNSVYIYFILEIIPYISHLFLSYTNHLNKE